MLATLYISGGFAIASYYGYGGIVPVWLLAAAGFSLVLAIMLYGSLYMAVGSACSELKDAQSLMMPIMLLSMFPAFVWTAVVQNPSSAVSVGMSLFPPASPFLMLMRLALRPAPPVWQVLLAVTLDDRQRTAVRLGGRQDLPDRALDAGQGPQLSRAGAVGDGALKRQTRFGSAVSEPAGADRALRPLDSGWVCWWSLGRSM